MWKFQRRISKLRGLDRRYFDPSFVTGKRHELPASSRSYSGKTGTRLSAKITPKPKDDTDCTDYTDCMEGANLHFGVGLAESRSPNADRWFSDPRRVLPLLLASQLRGFVAPQLAFAEC